MPKHLQMSQIFCNFASKINNMPKAALYITAKFMWTFLFYDTDVNENRAHVHVGKKDTKKLGSPAKPCV